MEGRVAPFGPSPIEVAERLQQAPPPDVVSGCQPGCWTLKRVQQAIAGLRDYSLSGIWRILQRACLSWRPGRPQRFSPDPDYTNKEARLLHVLQAAGADSSQVVLFLDEMGFYRWPEAGRDWVPDQPIPTLTRTCADNNRQWRILGVLNACTGQVNYLDNYIVGRRVLASFYPLIDQLYPQAEHIYVVQDNWSIHLHPDVLAVLSTYPRLQPVWLPTYAHWLNPIEKLWRWLRLDVLHLHRSAGDWNFLLHQVHTFLDQFAQGSPALLRYVGLLGEGKLASAIRHA